MLDLSSQPSLSKILACISLNPGLYSILVYDAPYQGLQEIAMFLAPLLAATTGSHVQQVTLGSFENDDDVWGSLYLPSGNNKISKRKRLFTPDCEELQLVTIADLSRLNQATARTCVMLIGADVAHLERNGQHETWKPQQCWLAGCISQDVGTVSPHLLDRFAIRLSWEKLVTHDQRSEQTKIADLLATIPHSPKEKPAVLSDYFIKRIANAAKVHVDFTEEALIDVLKYVDPEHYYPRRTLALARFAVALAQWEGRKQLRAEDVDEAAELLGLINSSKPSDEDVQSQQETGIDIHEEKVSIKYDIAEEVVVSQSVTEQLEMYQTETTETIDLDLKIIEHSSYLEDTAFIEREAASLKISRINYTAVRQGRGPIYGLEESNTITDLSLIGTLLSAAKFHTIRQQERKKKNLPDQQGLLFEPIDLHRYRRGETTALLLMLLLDYTCVNESDNWQAALLPYLREAYVERAEVTIVKVGAKDAQDQLQAEILSARNIMVQLVDDALYDTGKGATPLAHGLNLCLNRLHHVLQHGRNTVQRVIFVVVSDGRGNVPLQASLKGKITHIVTREGIEDALIEARKIRTLKRIETIVLSPPLEIYTDLPKLLADALGAVALETIEVEPSEEVAP